MERKQYIAPVTEVLDTELEGYLLGISIDKGTGGPGIAESRNTNGFDDEDDDGYNGYDGFGYGFNE